MCAGIPTPVVPRYRALKFLRKELYAILKLQCVKF